MKRLITPLLFLLLVTGAQAATTFTEFYCVTTGSNTNSGSTTAGAVYASVNGNWDGTSVFIPVDGSNPSGTVSAGMWASVYLDGAAVAVYIGRITTVTNAVNGGIIIDTSAKAGTAPASGLTGRTICVGGAWKGPNAASSFPFGFVTSTMTNLNSGIVQGFVPRVNFKNGVEYDFTSAMTHANNGPIRWQGYTTNPGDEGKAILFADNLTGFTVLTASCANNDFSDLIFYSNATSGNTDCLNISGQENTWNRVVTHDIRRTGFALGSVQGNFIGCEAYACNKAAVASQGGFVFVASSAPNALRCISHDNVPASNGNGFVVSGGGALVNCIADSNAATGMLIPVTTAAFILGCDLYNNTLAGIDLTGASATSIVIQNCSFVKNGTYGIISSGSPIRNGSIFNCGFGSGTATNAVGTIAPSAALLNEVGTVTYPANSLPWVDAPNGDFRINLVQAKGAGRGGFTETSSGYSAPNTISYPDIGAGQHIDTPTERSSVFAQ